MMFFNRPTNSQSTIKHLLINKYRLLPLVLILAACSLEEAPTLPTMQVTPGSDREVAYTDKQDAFWATRTGGYNSSFWQGLTASKRAYLEDVFIFADSVLLPRERAQIVVTPVSLTRRYAGLGITETWTLLDTAATLVIQLEAENPINWNIQPAIMGGNKSDDFIFGQASQSLNVTLRPYQHLKQAYTNLLVRFSDPVVWESAHDPGKQLYSAFLSPSARIRATRSLSIAIELTKDDQQPNTWDKATILEAINRRSDRIERDLSRVEIQSNQPRYNQAVSWAHSSIDALIMNQQGSGIYAGLPWFDDYWGRDTFIAFTGAVLVSGRFATAREILLAFSRLQNIDPADPNYGRVPNRAQPEDIIYNTTDGTPWFVRSIWDYYRYSGDSDFVHQLWPAVKHAFLGASRNYMDEHGLLRHAAADTWMDARGPDGAWSPRGDRAIEVQFLWRDQLEITGLLAEMYGDEGIQTQTLAILEKLEAGLEQFKAKPDNYYADHLNEDGTQDLQIRPNIFVVSPMLQETCDWSSFKYLAPQLVTSSGVLSLSQTDSNFHPYHHLPGIYVQDAAYHNGIIWTWNSAAAITQANRFHQYHYVQALFDDLTDQILNRGAVGSISELTDAWPREGIHQLSGTFTQAWSIAEYLRSFYQDILGVQPDLPQSRVNIAPRLLPGLDRVDFKVPLGDDTWSFQYDNSETQFDITISRTLSARIVLDMALLNDATISHLELPWNGQTLHLRYEKHMGQWTVPSDIADYLIKREPIKVEINSLPFCELEIDRDLPALNGPDHRLLLESDVLKPFEDGHEIFSSQDPQNDDRGDIGSYIYPLNPHFKQGIADIRAAKLLENEQDYLFELQFEDLVNPGWHSEYGYQLTYVSMGISYDPSTGTPELGKNSQAFFKNGFRADQILHVAGGILLVNEQHRSLVEYLPEGISGAIGDVSMAAIRFVLPKDIFTGDLNTAAFQIAVGCQDDHGGAGIGDYRRVQTDQAEWAGGGKVDSSASNIYDWLIIPGSH